jgi:hypothetical protein
MKEEIGRDAKDVLAIVTTMWPDGDSNKIGRVLRAALRREIESCEAPPAPKPDFARAMKSVVNLEGSDFWRGGRSCDYDNLLAVMRAVQEKVVPWVRGPWLSGTMSIEAADLLRALGVEP